MDPKTVNDDALEAKKLEAEIEAKRARSAARLAAVEGKAKLEELRREADFEEVLADLAEVHGLPYPAGHNIAALRSLDVMVVVRRVPEAAYKAFQKVAERANDKNPIPDATIERFVREGLLYPSQDEFSRIATEKPMVVLHACKALQNLHGAALKDAEGKA